MSPDQTVPRGVAAVVLAAGLSRRFGRPKQLALLEGRTLLEHVLEVAQASGLRPVIAVVPAWLARPAPPDEQLVWVPNPEPERGLSRSIQLGLSAVPAEVDAAVILLGDQPTVTATTIGSIVAARGGRPILVSFAEGHVAPPALVERSAFELAAELEGDAGLRQLAARHPELVRRVGIERHAPDIDHLADLERISAEQP